MKNEVAIRQARAKEPDLYIVVDKTGMERIVN
jgi:hypothetical protein